MAFGIKYPHIQKTCGRGSCTCMYHTINNRMPSEPDLLGNICQLMVERILGQINQPNFTHWYPLHIAWNYQILTVELWHGIAYCMQYTSSIVRYLLQRLTGAIGLSGLRIKFGPRILDSKSIFLPGFQYVWQIGPDFKLLLNSVNCDVSIPGIQDLSIL